MQKKICMKIFVMMLAMVMFLGMGLTVYAVDDFEAVELARSEPIDEPGQPYENDEDDEDENDTERERYYPEREREFDPEESYDPYDLHD